jgi:hypothetical protein
MREISAAILVVAGVIALSTCSLMQFSLPHVTLLPLGLALTGVGLYIWYKSISTPNNVSITVDRVSVP